MEIWSICWSETVDNEIREYWERYTDEEKAKARTIELMKMGRLMQTRSLSILRPQFFPLMTSWVTRCAIISQI
jgi:hypothetical protein